MTDVTIAICTWNRAALLRETLTGLTRLRPSPIASWSLLVVDNNSNDDTQQVLASFAGKLPLRSVFEGAPGVSSARNRALREARGELILWTDDDVLVDEHWLAEFVAVAARYPEASAFGGPILPWFVAEPDPLYVDVFPWLRSGFCGLDYQREEGPLPVGMHLVGANFGLRLPLVSGLTFNTALGASPAGGLGEDTAFMHELERDGHTLVWCPSMRVRHYVDPDRMSLPYLEQYTFHRGRQVARRLGFAPDGTGPYSVPRWIWRETMRLRLLDKVTRVTPIVPALPGRLRSGASPTLLTPQARRMAWRRERLFMEGVLDACRERARATAAPGALTARGVAR